MFTNTITYVAYTVFDKHTCNSLSTYLNPKNLQAFLFWTSAIDQTCSRET